MKDIRQPDIVVIGSGISGLYTAINIDNSLNVLVLSKGTIENTNSILAQGGIAACLNKEHDFKLYTNDTIVAGSKRNNMDALKTMILESKNNIDILIDLGVEFDKYKNNELKTTLEGGHSSRRILHAGGDATGKEVIYALRNKIENKSNIDLLHNSMVIDIKKESNYFSLELITNDKFIKLTTSAVVIATGGIGGIYKNSTNPRIATGDGIALAYRLGCELDDLEYIQFHPTAFYSEEVGEKFLISEAVRGEGAYLRNSNGERFMLDIHSRAELAPRDIVSRGIFNEMKKNNISHVFLDITHKDKNYLINRFPTIYNKCLAEGIDMAKDFIPVVPVEHYFIGGIKTDVEGKTNVKGIYACGECANTGVHGANRLASNSLLECIVFGMKVANHLNLNFNRVPLSKSISVKNIKENIEDYEVETTKNNIRETMDKYVGIMRSKNNLYKAKDTIKEILNEVKKTNIKNKEYKELENMALIADLIVKSCINNKESIGCHYRIN
ncbi:L-aspartate oxidase [Clostridium sp. D2Q-11]|uniref:L-aspartate oxidase n=1 Tax=Anaeromonas frigoriresistens TaxID=2683708 RepID=A0A942Z7U5_9FIRM|nr:L-aspartate oxidase [Anaeromonas frigoriresistens]MBS4537623.1 L-aspartate oxidase [Anaeromonas frigoriresistens]